MTLPQRVGILIIAGFTVIAGIELGARFSISGVPSIISPAEAVIGRPLTPVSVAGVGRRTVRRCAVGIYDCH